MSGGIGSKLALALFLAFAGPAAMAIQVVDPANARRAVTSPVIVAIDTQLAALAAAGRSSELAARLALIASDQKLETVAQEWLLDRGLHLLATLEPTVEARRIVLRLATRGPLVYTHADPDLGDRAVPLYDGGATARFVLKTWQRAAARDRAAADLSAGRIAVIARFEALAASRGSESERAGIADAFAAAPIASLAPQRAAIVAALAAGHRVDEPALILARRTADAGLMSLVLGHAEAPVALAAIRDMRPAFDSQTALELLATASLRADIASAAMLEAGRLARDDANARRFVFDALEDSDLGPSAAAALAALGDPGVAAELGRRLAASRSEGTRRMLVLALRLDPGDAAREELRRFAATGRGSLQLQQEVRQWLDR